MGDFGAGLFCKEVNIMDLKLYPLKFLPNMYEYVWGGNRLNSYKGLPADDRKLGESWEVSAVPGKESVVAEGCLAGKTLQELVADYGERLLGPVVAEQFGGKFPILVKFIDAAKDLSVQVHPDDSLAMARHGSFGKEEMWYVIDAEPGASLLSGFSKKISPDEYEKGVVDGSICDVISKHEVHEGDVFFIPAGRVHAIGAGIFLVEIQQSSDITYRIYDYNRLGLDGKPRQLHTELAKDAIDYEVHDDYKTKYTVKRNEASGIVSCRNFTVGILDADKSVVRNMRATGSFVIYICMKGTCRIRVEGSDASDFVDLSQGESCLVPAECADIELVPGEGGMKILEVYSGISSQE